MFCKCTDSLTERYKVNDHVIKAFQYLQKHAERPDVCEILKLLCPTTSGRPYGLVCTSAEFYPVIAMKCSEHVPMNVYIGTKDTGLQKMSKRCEQLPGNEVQTSLEGIIFT